MVRGRMDRYPLVMAGMAALGLAALGLAAVSLATSSLVACSQETPVPPIPGVVAQVGPRAIGAAELRDFVRQMPPTLRSRKTGDAARQEYLRSLMARHVMALEAGERGLDTVAAVVQRSEARWRQHLIGLCRREILSPQVDISEEQIQQYFEIREMSRERQLSAIVLHSEAAAREVVERLAGGDLYETVASEVSVDERSALQGGVLGFVSLGEARRLNIPEEAFRTLGPGQVGPVVALGRSFQVFRFLDEREAEVAEHRGAIKRVLRERELARLEEALVDELASELGWHIDREGLGALLEVAEPRGYARRRDLSEETGRRPLFRYAGGEVQVGDFVDAVWTNPTAAVQGWGTADSASVEAAARQLVLGPEMLLEAARRAGMAARPEEQAWRRRVTEELAIQELRRREAVTPSVVSTEEAREFYEEHQEAFRRPMEAHIVEVLVATEAEAEHVLAQVAGGRALAGLAAELSQRDGAPEQAGLMVVDDHVRLGHPKLYWAVEKAALGEIAGPVSVSGGYSVFEIIHREGGDVLPFTAVESKARALARKQRKDELLGELIEARLDHLGDGVVVYAGELARALPDSFLADSLLADSLLEAGQASSPEQAGST